MGLFSFGKKGKDKIKRLMEENKIDEVIEKALKDKKTVRDLVELLSDSNPGTVGDALFVLTTILRESPNSIDVSWDLVDKVLSLVLSKNSYVKEGAMVLTMEIIKVHGYRFKDTIDKHVPRLLSEGDKNTVAFTLLLIKELSLSKYKEEVEKLTEVEDKIILPFEGMKWVKLGDIARDVLKEL
ncbi:hypothetical protein [Pyrococcus kukulkanii]|uniref:HEAT repeat domain-containing protein n=1 Tax=Pyrococcus kukulkanii TaxID=1609559 RepID=A0ABV4T3Y8_9EURY